MSYRGMGSFSGFGAIADTFSAAAVWADIQTSDTCYGPGAGATALLNVGTCNAASQRATTAIQSALVQLGFSVAVDGMWGPGTSAAWKSFMATQGLPLGPGMGVTEDGLKAMEGQLKQGAQPGPQGTGTKKASLATIGILAALGLGAAALAVSAKKKKTTTARGTPGYAPNH